MAVFGIRDAVIDEYQSFTTSFVEPRSPRIRDLVRSLVGSGRQWPDPRVSLNPFFASGGSIADAVSDGALHPDCARILRVKEEDPAAPAPRGAHRIDPEAAGRTNPPSPLRPARAPATPLGRRSPVPEPTGP